MFINIYKDTCLLIFTQDTQCLFIHRHMFINIYTDTVFINIYKDTCLLIFTKTHVY